MAEKPDSNNQSVDRNQEKIPRITCLLGCPPSELRIKMIQAKEEPFEFVLNQVRFDRIHLDFLLSFKYMQSLDLSGCSKISESDIQLLAQLTQLKRLVLVGCRGIRPAYKQILNDALPDCKIVYQLTFREKIRNNPGLLFAMLFTLLVMSWLACLFFMDTGIKAGSRQKMQKPATDEELAELVRMDPQMAYLDLSFCNMITDDGLANLVSLKHLWGLNLSFCNRITDQGMKHIVKITSLTEVNLTGCTQVSKEGIISLAALPLLRDIELSRRWNNDDGLDIRTHFPCFINDTTLEMKEWAITDHGLEFLSKMKKLEILTLDRCHQITDHGLKSLKAIKSLSHLNLQNMNITGTGLQQLSSGNLQMLAVQSCSINEQGITAMGQLKSLNILNLSFLGLTSLDCSGLSELKKLDTLMLTTSAYPKSAPMDLSWLGSLDSLNVLLLENIEIKDHGIRSMTQLPHFQTFTMTGSRFDDSLLFDLAALPHLKTINLDEHISDNLSSNITDQGLAALSKMDHLQSLSIGGDQVTDQGLLELASCKSLKQLNVMFCPRLTRHGILAFKKAHPQCKIKFLRNWD